MDARSFYKKVQKRADLADEYSAKRASKTVLQTLHWRLLEGEADDIEATLPPELKKIWRGNLAMILAKKLGRVDKINKEQFVNRVRRMNKISSLDTAEKLTMAVIHVLKEAIPREETIDMLAQLPRDLKKFIKAA